MDRLHSDPSFLICPDFMIERYRISRTSMVTANVTEAQAADTLRTIWTTTNEALCLQWAKQVAEDARLADEEKRVAKEEAERLQVAQQLEEDTLKVDEKKKNRLKHLEIPMRPRPFTNDEEALVSEFALRKLDKGHYVELYYWTNDGLDDAVTNYRTHDDDSMVPTIGEDGSTVWISSAASKPSGGVIADRDLTPANFAQAIPCIVNALEERDWAPQRVIMLARFWGAIMLHRYWNFRDLIAQKTILLFQEEQRRAWHHAISSAKGAWNIAIIDEQALSRTFDRMYWALLLRPEMTKPDTQVHKL
ncbi:hypothetical protein EV424DRAFT_1352288 [Suillus variegatus]|nr:hypothetical protein EV424DRAFT_1352288 [Suillus variegatus]